MATRLMLTLLAVLTGLAAQFAPAQARAFRSADTEIGAAARTATAARRVVVAIARPNGAGPGALRVPTAPQPQEEALGLALPAVLQGIDRARQ